MRQEGYRGAQGEARLASDHPVVFEVYASIAFTCASLLLG